MTTFASWRELPRWMQVLRAGLFIGSAIWMISWFVVGIIETAALRQPTVSDSYFRYPHKIKGHTRFFSGPEEDIYAIAKPLMPGSFIGTFVLLIVCGSYEEQRKRRETKEALQHFAQRMSEQDSGL